MASEDILDFDRLLAPIGGANAAGEDLRADTSPGAPFLKLKDARNTARAAERQSENEGLVDLPGEWRVVLALAPDLLANRSKDLEIACWMVEALVRHHGFAGLRDGLKLLDRLIVAFWEGLYPEEDEEGLETKIAPLVGLLGDAAGSPLIQALRKVSLTQGQDPGPFASWHYDVAIEVAKIADQAKQQRRLAGGAILPATFAACFDKNEPGFVRNLADDLDASIDALKALADALDSRCGDHAPNTSPTRDILERIVGLVRHLGASVLVAEAPVEAATAEPDQEGSMPTTDGVRRSGFTSREDAFKALLEVADYFRRTEPHSFLPLMLENVVRRGQMPLSDLLVDLVPDDNARKALYLRAGMTGQEGP